MKCECWSKEKGLHYQDSMGILYLPHLTVRGWCQLFPEGIPADRISQFEKAREAAETFFNSPLFQELK